MSSPIDFIKKENNGLPSPPPPFNKSFWNLDGWRRRQRRESKIMPLDFLVGCIWWINWVLICPVPPGQDPATSCSTKSQGWPARKESGAAAQGKEGRHSRFVINISYSSKSVLAAELRAGTTSSFSQSLGLILAFRWYSSWPIRKFKDIIPAHVCIFQEQVFRISWKLTNKHTLFYKQQVI